MSLAQRKKCRKCYDASHFLLCLIRHDMIHFDFCTSQPFERIGKRKVTYGPRVTNGFFLDNRLRVQRAVARGTFARTHSRTHTHNAKRTGFACPVGFCVPTS